MTLSPGFSFGSSIDEEAHARQLAFGKSLLDLQDAIEDAECMKKFGHNEERRKETMNEDSLTNALASLANIGPNLKTTDFDAIEILKSLANFRLNPCDKTPTVGLDAFSGLTSDQLDAVEYEFKKKLNDVRSNMTKRASTKIVNAINALPSAIRERVKSSVLDKPVAPRSVVYSEAPLEPGAWYGRQVGDGGTLVRIIASDDNQTVGYAQVYTSAYEPKAFCSLSSSELLQGIKNGTFGPLERRSWARHEKNLLSAGTSTLSTSVPKGLKNAQ
jgi:hypothetical protein